MKSDMASVKDTPPNVGSLASAMWTDEFWYPDSSLMVVPPLDPPYNESDPNMPALVVGKQALLSCLKYTKNPEPMTDIWQAFDEEENAKRQLIGSVVKTSDGSYQLFKDHTSHIGINQTVRSCVCF